MKASRSMRLSTLSRGAGGVEVAEFVRAFRLAASRSPSPCLSPGEREPASCVFVRSGVASVVTVRSAIQRRDSRTTQRVRFATQRRAILPRPKGEGRGEGETTPETPTPLTPVVLSGCREICVWVAQGTGSGGPVELSLQDSSDRCGWLRLVPPHPYPLPQGEGPHAAPRRVRAPWVGESVADDSPSPPRRGRGSVLRRPRMRLRHFVLYRADSSL